MIQAVRDNTYPMKESMNQCYESSRAYAYVLLFVSAGTFYAYLVVICERTGHRKRVGAVEHPRKYD